MGAEAALSCVRRTALLVVLVAATGFGTDRAATPRRHAVCFAPGADAATVARVLAATADAKSFVTHESWRWSGTATQAHTGPQGFPVTLTWSIVPDGTRVPGISYARGGDSDLRAFLDGLYGDESTWLPLLESVFEDWTEHTGVTFVRETADDGAEVGEHPGLLGVRGDIRLSGLDLGSDVDVLAYAGFPDDGDVVIHTGHAYYGNKKRRSRRLRNTVSHEIGHALGLAHVCPNSGTKLMEPFGTEGYDGPQYDDVRGAQFLYGDEWEPDGFWFLARPLELSSGRATVRGVIAGTMDFGDTFAFDAPRGGFVDVRVRPLGRSYRAGRTSPDGECGGEHPKTDTRRAGALYAHVRGTDGATLIGSGPGFVERGEDHHVLDVELVDGPGTYYVGVGAFVFGDVQEYELVVKIAQRGAKPRTEPDEAVTWRALPVHVDVLANDAGLADAPIRLEIDGPPFAGEVRRHAGGLVYVPARGYVGLDMFSYRVRDADGQSANGHVDVQIVGRARAGGARPDFDGDGYPDELEHWLGSAPDDAADLPAEPLDETGRELPVSHLRIEQSPRRSSRDRLTLRGELALDATFEPAGSSVAVAVAGAHRRFTLDERGRSVGASPDALRLRLDERVDVGSTSRVPFDLKLRRADLGAVVVDEGLTTDRTHRREPRELTLFVIVDDRTFEATVQLDHAAKRGRSGKTRLAR